MSYKPQVISSKSRLTTYIIFYAANGALLKSKIYSHKWFIPTQLYSTERNAHIDTYQCSTCKFKITLKTQEKWSCNYFPGWDRTHHLCLSYQNHSLTDHSSMSNTKGQLCFYLRECLHGRENRNGSPFSPSEYRRQTYRNRWVGILYFAESFG